MQDLIENSCNITREKNSKTMSTNHLSVFHCYLIIISILLNLKLQTQRKLCVTTIERFDFLADIVQNIPDIEPEPKRGRPRYILLKSKIYVK